jgi:myo-inositol-1(or 4)-monophosphatase
LKYKLDIALRASENAHKIALSFINDAKTISSINKDIKTLVDLKMNDSIVSDLSNTKCDIISEESDSNFDFSINETWIIDPLDGTFNFTIKYPCAAISIALFKDRIPLLGVVRDVFSKTVYHSILNNGSYKDGILIKTSNTQNIEDAVLATGFPSGSNYETNKLLKFVKNIQKFKKIRSIGSASMMLVNVASGIFDVYYEKDIYLWDVAAGLSLVSESGGEYYIKQTSGFKYEVLASNKLIFKKAKELLVN